jgi:hypothetical protein
LFIDIHYIATPPSPQDSPKQQLSKDFIKDNNKIEAKGEFMSDLEKLERELEDDFNFPAEKLTKPQDPTLVR